MPSCYILIGPPGVGKSTWMEKQDFLNEHYVVSSDAVLESLAETYNLTYDELFETGIKLANFIANRDAELLGASGHDIVIDRTNMSRTSRRKWINKLKGFGYTFHAVVFEIPEKEEWQRRLNSRPGKTIPQNAIDNMMSSFEFPVENEGFSTIEAVTQT